jgi:hypothetical protein
VASSQIVTAANNQNGAAINTSFTATATCPAGKILLGGGALITTSGSAAITDQAVVVGTWPSAGNAWQAVVKATTVWASGHHLITNAYAICTT